METWRAKEDDQGNVILDDNGRYQRDSLTGVFVMRKEPGFGAAYEMNRTGEWEYVAFRPGARADCRSARRSATRFRSRAATSSCVPSTRR